jgi:hypothetical protein
MKRPRQITVVLGLAMVCGQGFRGSANEPPAKVELRPLPVRPGDFPLVQMIRGGNTCIGDFDKDGNFLRDPRFKPNYAISRDRPYILWVSPTQHFVYEHRSGRLIKGTTVENPRGVFVPEIGSKVLDIKDVDLKKPDRMVYNMPEMTADYVAERKRKHGDKPPPKAPYPLLAGTPDRWEFIPFSRLDTDWFGRKLQEVKPIRHARAIGDTVEFGHLSDQGEFIPDPDLPLESRASLLRKVKFDPPSLPRYYTVPKVSKGQATEEVYEFRSGRLIKGTLQKTGNFDPELGSKILDFKDYDPLSRRRIYNLPGVLRPVKK